jgi:LysM repeat protein
MGINKKILMRKLIFLLTLLMVFTACGQQKKYVSYTVKKGETLKSIAKDNGIKTKDLLNLNPDVSRKPSANTVIIIPNNKKKISDIKTNDYQGLTHKVKRKETLFSIAKKYNVTVDELKKANDLNGNRLSVGRIIYIPEVIVEEVIEVVEEVVEESSFIIHTVEKGDTLYNLTKRFDISEDELKAMNPQLEIDGLKLGMVLKLGEKHEDTSVNLFIDEITNKPLNIVLMLPYKVNSTIDYNSQFKKKNSLINIVTDFHSGVLMAVDSLKRQGMNVSLKVIDTENKMSKLSSIIDTYDFDNTDAVIGPLFLKNARFVSKKLSNIPVIAPMYSKNQSLISGNDLVKVAPDKKLVEEKLLNHLLEDYAGEKIIISGDDSPSSTSKIAKLSLKLKEHDSISEITVIKPEEGYIDRERFHKVIDTLYRKNWVILVGNDNITTNDVVNSLGVISKEKAKIQLFSFDFGSNFSNVSNEQLERLNFTYPSSEFVDELNDETKRFNKKYRSKYYNYPSQYAIKGFDVTYDVLLRLTNYDSFNEGAGAGVSQRIGSKFEYNKKLFGSQENNGVFLIQYQEGLTLKSIE